MCNKLKFLFFSLCLPFASALPSNATIGYAISKTSKAFFNDYEMPFSKDYWKGVLDGQGNGVRDFLASYSSEEGKPSIATPIIVACFFALIFDFAFIVLSAFSYFKQMIHLKGLYSPDTWKVVLATILSPLLYFALTLSLLPSVFFIPPFLHVLVFGGISLAFYYLFSWSTDYLFYKEMKPKTALQNSLQTACDFVNSLIGNKEEE